MKWWSKKIKLWMISIGIFTSSFAFWSTFIKLKLANLLFISYVSSNESNCNFVFFENFPILHRYYDQLSVLYLLFYDTTEFWYRQLLPAAQLFLLLLYVKSLRAWKRDLKQSYFTFVYLACLETEIGNLSGLLSQKFKLSKERKNCFSTTEEETFFHFHIVWILHPDSMNTLSLTSMPLGSRKFNAKLLESNKFTFRTASRN